MSASPIQFGAITSARRISRFPISKYTRLAAYGESSVDVGERLERAMFDCDFAHWTKAEAGTRRGFGLP
jgi:hypothetical protein